MNSREFNTIFSACSMYDLLVDNSNNPYVALYGMSVPRSVEAPYKVILDDMATLTSMQPDDDSLSNISLRSSLCLGMPILYEYDKLVSRSRSANLSGIFIRDLSCSELAACVLQICVCNGYNQAIINKFIKKNKNEIDYNFIAGKLVTDMLLSDNVATGSRYLVLSNILGSGSGKLVKAVMQVINSIKDSTEVIDMMVRFNDHDSDRHITSTAAGTVRNSEY